MLGGTKNTVRERYNELLESALPNEVFYGHIAALLENDPYFFPGYLEFFSKADEDNDREYRLKLFIRAHERAARVFRDRTLRAQLEERWSLLEKEALVSILKKITHSSQCRYSRRFLARGHAFIANELIRPKTELSPIEPRHLKKVAALDPKPLQQELAALPSYWWQLHLERSQNISSHRKTRAIVLRKLGHHNAEYEAHDGVHESVPTHAASVLPRLHETILRLSSDLNIALGRVAVVKLSPFSEVYRHYDSEPFLQARDRHHFVLDAGARNLLFSGRECANAQPGELWFFDNKVMHRAENNTSAHRIHVIFDGYPLENVKREETISKGV